VRVGIVALAVGMTLSVVFVLTLAATGWAPPHAGIAAATACSALLNASLLLRGLKRSAVYVAGSGWKVLVLRVGGAAAVMAVALAAALAVAGDWLRMGLLTRIGVLSALVCGGAAVYFAACFSLGLRPSEFRIRSVV
jgi:putative peptidoglycan lipid II flippase